MQSMNSVRRTPFKACASGWECGTYSALKHGSPATYTDRTAKQEPHFSPRTPSGTIVNMSQTDFLPTGPELTVVVPVFNEEEGLAALFPRLYPALDALGATYEVIFINDGSRDKSAILLAQQFR